MGDADVAIIKETLTLAEAYKCVEVVADGTDIFICLLFHSTRDTDIIMRTKKDCINDQCQKSAGISGKISHGLPSLCTLCFWLLYNFFFFGIGKLKAVKLVKESKVLQQKIKVIGEDNASQEQLCEAGEQFILAMYQGGISSIQ